MTAPLYMGIDGGGTSLRVTIVDDALSPLVSVTAGSANPNIIGQAQAEAHIQRWVTAALERAGLVPGAIAAAGIGIAGASDLHSRAWLLRTVHPVLPDSLLVASSDLEIALVGAHGQRHGLLLHAGTGSAAFGVTPAGAFEQIGGWGYLLGDEGSSFWIGVRLLRQVMRYHNYPERDHPKELVAACMRAMGVSDPRDMVHWVYRGEGAPPARVASLAKLALQLAEDGNWAAQNIVKAAAIQLTRQVAELQRRLDYPDAPIAFAGGLLDKDNCLSRDVAQRLGLPRRPIPKHSPATGAALLAQLGWREWHQ